MGNQIQEKKEDQVGALEVFLDFFSSVRLTIFLCIALAASSALGTFFPQNLSAAETARHFGEPLAKLFGAMGVGDLYHSGWFRLLIGLLALNLITCSLRRLPKVWRGISRVPKNVSEASLKKWRHSKTLKTTLGRDEALEKIREVLGRKAEELDEGFLLIARRGRSGRLGPYVTHLGVLIILAGAVIGSLFGFRGHINLLEGESADSVWINQGTQERPLGFEIRCDRFVFEQYDDGTPKEYRSEVTILEVGSAVGTDHIRVNHPLNHQGIYFYQSNYGVGGFEAVFDVVASTGGEKTTLRVDSEEPVVLPDGKTKLRVVDASLDMEMPGGSMDGHGRRLGPATAILLLDETGTHQGPFWILKNYPDLAKGSGTPFDITLVDLGSSYFTGLEVSRDPGVGFVWTGCTILLVGIMMSFFIHRRVYAVRVAEAEESRAIVVAARTGQGRGDIEREFETISEAIAREMNPSD